MNENQITNPAEPRPRDSVGEQVRFGSDPVRNFEEQRGNSPAAGGRTAEDAGTASSGAQELRERAEALRNQAGQAMERGEAYVRENPMPVLFGTLTLGIIIGLAVGRRSAPTARERYLEQPVLRVRDVLAAALLPMARRLRDQYGRAQVGVHDASARMADMDLGGRATPLRKGVRRFGQMLKIW